MTKLDNNLVVILEKQQMNQSQLAEALGIAPGLITLYASGQREPTVSRAILIARALGVSVEDIFTIEESSIGSQAS